MIATILLLLGSVLLIAHRRADTPYLRGTTVDYTAAENYWYALIERKGMENARAAFTGVASSLPIGAAHTLAHSFGDALYRAFGADGIAGCDDAFIYGCYHQLVGKTIAAEGLQAVAKLYAACKKLDIRSFACGHGIGHGIVGYTGYSFSDLHGTLRTCQSLDDAVGRSGCMDGAFMEYNIHELASLNESGVFIPRELSEKDIYSPCDALDWNYGNSCAFELPNWWFATLVASSTSDLATRSGTYCAAIAIEPDVRHACFRGLGYMIAAETNFDMVHIREQCTDSQSEGLDRVMCLSGAALRFRTAKQPRANAACEALGLTDSSRAYCEAFAASGNNAEEPIPAPTIKNSR